MTQFLNFFSCVRGHRSHAHKTVSSSLIKIKFGEPLNRHTNKDCHLPQPIFHLITFLAHEGIQTKDLFRRPGNINQMNSIIKLLAQGKPVQWTKYNIYTCANVAKKYLLNLPGGLFGRKGETMLLDTIDWNEEDRITAFLELLREMITVTQELTILLFGILFRMVTHAVNVQQSMSYTSQPDSVANMTDSSSEWETCQMNYPQSSTEQFVDSQNLNNRQFILAEAVAKSVAGSLFHTCRDSPDKVERASKVLESLILAFPSFDAEFIDFFDQSMHCISHSTSSHEVSISGSFKIVRKPSVLAASLEIWSESFGKSRSQRNSLKEANQNLHEKSEPETKKVSHVLFHNVPDNIPSITITSPHGEVNFPESLPNSEKAINVHTNDINTAKTVDVTSFRHFQTRLQSMKRRHQANLKKRSDWFLNNFSSPVSPILGIEDDYNTFVVVTCGGSSICLGQSPTTVSGNKCILMQPKNADIISSYFASSRPVILQIIPGDSRPETPDYSTMSHVMACEDYFYSLSNSNAYMYEDTRDIEINDHLSSSMDRDDLCSNVEEAPNSVPLIRRMLPSRSSISSRKASIQQDYNIQRYQSSGSQEEDDEDEYLIEDTQSDC